LTPIDTKLQPPSPHIHTSHMLINPEKMSRRSHYNYVENQVILSILLMLFALTATARQIRPGYDQPPQLSIFTAASFLCPE